LIILPRFDLFFFACSIRYDATPLIRHYAAAGFRRLFFFTTLLYATRFAYAPPAAPLMSLP